MSGLKPQYRLPLLPCYLLCSRGRARVPNLLAAANLALTVSPCRQFAMEDKEHSKYSVSNLFRRVLERRLRTVERFTWGIIGVGFWGSQILITWVGLQMILTAPAAAVGVRPPMTVSQVKHTVSCVYACVTTLASLRRIVPAFTNLIDDCCPTTGLLLLLLLLCAWFIPCGGGQLTVICVNMHDICWATRYIIDLVPELMKLEEPIQRVAVTLGTIPRIEPHPDAPDFDQKLKPKFRGHLVFDNVYFTYPTEKQKLILKGFSFEVKPGQKVACVGSAGCGKSTSVGLLQRLYDPDRGVIKIDGNPIGDYDVHHLRRCTGIVAQVSKAVCFTLVATEKSDYAFVRRALSQPSEKDTCRGIDLMDLACSIVLPCSRALGCC